MASAGALALTGALSAMVSRIAVEQREQLGREIRELTAPAKRPATYTLTPAAVSAPEQLPTPALATAAARWQIQIGSFRNEAAAVAQLRSTAARLPELANYWPRTEPHRGNTRARIGGINGAERAHELCVKVVEAGSACYVVPPG
jgi:cell division septation protein DedD